MKSFIIVFAFVAYAGAAVVTNYASGVNSAGYPPIIGSVKRVGDGPGIQSLSLSQVGLNKGRVVTVILPPRTSAASLSILPPSSANDSGSNRKGLGQLRQKRGAPSGIGIGIPINGPGPIISGGK